MQFTGTVVINAPRETVWPFVTDPDKVGWCGPGVESIVKVDETHYRARAKVGVGYISARFDVHLELVDEEAPLRAVLKARGQAPGSAVDALATMHLRDGDEGSTRMDWIAEVSISGTIASVGSRLIQGTANKMIAATFDCIKAKLEA